MASKKPTPREELRDLTTKRILDAFLKLAVGEAGLLDPSSITYRRIADLAGVSERTVYRFFPAKEEFERASIESGLVFTSDIVPERAADLTEYLRRVTSELAGKVPGPVVRNRAGESAEMESFGKLRAQRGERIARALGDVLPADLDDADRRAVIAVVRTLASLGTVIATASDWEMSMEEAGRAHAWAVDVIIKAIEEGNGGPWPNEPIQPTQMER